MKESSKATLLALVEGLERALRERTDDASTPDALYHCERLRLAIQSSHAEGTRFAAFTIGRLLDRAQPPVDSAVAQSHQALRQGLIDDGVRL